MKPWDVSPPPGLDHEIARWTLDRPPQLAGLRASLQQAVAAFPAAGGTDRADLEERILIVATELVGNALRHGRKPAVVILLRCDDDLVIDVVDHDPATAPVPGPRRAPGAGGLGLQLTERLARHVGWFPAESTKHIWARFAVTPAE
jgi:serine/threonine-protein kinase RsbW